MPKRGGTANREAQPVAELEGDGVTEGLGDVDGVADADGFGVAASVATAAWAWLASCTAAASRFCAAPYPAKSPAFRAVSLSFRAVTAFCSASCNRTSAADWLPFGGVGVLPASGVEPAPKTWFNAVSRSSANPILEPKLTSTFFSKG